MKDLNKLRIIGKVITPPNIYDGQFSQTMQNDVYFKSIIKIADRSGETYIPVLYCKDLFDFMKEAFEENQEIFSHGTLTTCFEDEHFNMLVLLNKAEFCKYSFPMTKTNAVSLSGKLIKTPKLYVLPKRNAYGLLIRCKNDNGDYENIHGSFKTPNDVSPLLKEGDAVACKGYLFNKISEKYRSFAQQSDKNNTDINFLRLRLIYVMRNDQLSKETKDELHHFDSNNEKLKKAFYDLYEDDLAKNN